MNVHSVAAAATQNNAFAANVAHSTRAHLLFLFTAN